MKKHLSSLVLTFAALALGATLSAQTAEKKEPAKKAPPPKIANSTGGTTPHETTSTVIDGNRITIVYGRPFAKHPRTGEQRKVWGGLVPFGKIWRTGADEATLLITQQPITLGGAKIPAGAYTLWTLPAADGSAKLIVNKQIGQWGAGELSKIYSEANDVARIDLTKSDLPEPVGQFTMAVVRGAGGGGTLTLSWESIRYSAEIAVQK